MIRVQKDDFDIGAEIETLTGGRTDIGAVVTFTGQVRSIDDDIKSMTLEHYPGMTDKELNRIDAQANKRWDLQASLIVHRYGRLLPGEQIVLVITASAHRQDAFEAASFLMDFLKTKAPFWKLEETSSGEAWVDAKDSDDNAAARWNKRD